MTKIGNFLKKIVWPISDFTCWHVQHWELVSFDRRIICWMVVIIPVILVVIIDPFNTSHDVTYTIIKVIEYSPSISDLVHLKQSDDTLALFDMILHFILGNMVL